MLTNGITKILSQKPLHINIVFDAFIDDGKLVAAAWAVGMEENKNCAS